MVSAWASANGIVLGQIKTDEKSNEITAIPELIKTLNNNPAVDPYETSDGDHGRIEIRRYWTTSDIKELWKNINTIGMVQRERQVGEDISIETSYYISSIENDTKLFSQAVRSHWGIENSLHWVLDISFREDESRIRKDNTPENFAVLRHMALNLLKRETSLKKSIKAKRLKAG